MHAIIVKSFQWMLIYSLMDNVCVISQICSSRRIVTKRVMEGQPRWYRETYLGQCYYSCVKTRWTMKTEQVSVTKREIQIFNDCCDGYINVDDGINSVSNETVPITCKPICMPACKNGFCARPGICSCNPGYTVDPADKHNCLPQCLKGCRHGSCVAPETCQCKFGYNTVDGTCQPVCTEPCDNGTCVAPETCECLSGFRKSDRNICEPYCSSGCQHGSCISPETCVCSPGYSLQIIDRENNTSCQPVCSPPCDNGICTAPNVCQCNAGYQIYDGYKCKPHCSNGCPNGSCIYPETCICYEGWSMDNNTVCKPICNTDCGNGSCVSPNTCDCHLGYRLNEVNNNDVETICVPMCKNCEGACIDTNVCICDPPFEAQNLTADGKTCNCHENCTDGMSKCDRTACSVVDREQWFGNDEATETSSSVIYIIDNSHTSDNINVSYTEESTIDSKNRILIYVTSTMFAILFFILVTILIMKWKYIIIYFKGSSYIVEEHKENAVIECSLRVLREKEKQTVDNNGEQLTEARDNVYSK